MCFFSDGTADEAATLTICGIKLEPKKGVHTMETEDE